MAAVTRSGMRAAEAAALAAGWSEEQLLDLAGARLGHALGRFFPQRGTAIGYLGKGHNAGDTLVALSVLRDEFGWQIAARNAFPIDDCAPLTREKWRQSGIGTPLDGPPPWRDLKRPLLLLDGLLGIGAQGALRDPLLKLAEEMEWLRQHAGARVAAVDLPSGVDPDTGESTPGAVTADATFMIGNPKAGLLTSHAVNAVGSLALVPLEILTVPGQGEIELISPQEMEFGKSPRPYDFHKGMAGRVAVIAGSDRIPRSRRARRHRSPARRSGTDHAPCAGSRRRSDRRQVPAGNHRPRLLLAGRITGFEMRRDGHRLRSRRTRCDAPATPCSIGSSNRPRPP